MKAVFLIAILTCCSRRYILVNSIVSYTSSNVGASSSLEQVVIPYLQSEMAACSNAQQSILKFLHEKLIPIGMAPGSLRGAQSSHRDDISSRITISSADNNIECRISLGRAPLGSKCVAPCGCTGSQKWVQFSELNKLRRKDPQQWTSCPTCQQKFDYSVFAVYGGLPASLVGYALDHPVILRSTIVSSLVVIGYFGSVKAWIYRFLVSRSLWQQYPQWSKLTHIPLALKFWAIKVVVQYLLELYLAWERGVVLSGIADFETALIEENLPVQVDDEEKLPNGASLVDNGSSIAEYDDSEI